MHAGFLDMLQHAGDDHLHAVANRVDIHFGRIAQILVDQHGAVARHLHGGGDIVFQLLRAVDDLHRAATQHIAWPQQHRITDALCPREGLFQAAGDAVFGLLEFELAHDLGKTLAVLGQVDGIGIGAQDRDARILQRLGQAQRGLPAKLHDHALQRAVGLLDRQNFEHVFCGQRFEIEPVGRIIIGAHRFRIAVDHDGFIARLFQRETGVAAAIIELDPLPDPVRPAAQDHDFLAVGRHRLILGLAKGRRFIGRIHIGRGGIELAGAAVDPLVDRAHAQLVAQRADFRLVRGTGHRLDDRADQPARLGDRAAGAMRDMHRIHRQIGQPSVRETHGFQAAQAGRVDRQTIGLDLRLGRDDRLDLAQEPGIVEGDRVDILHRKAFAHRLRHHQDALGRGLGQRLGDPLPAHALQLAHAVEAVEPGFQAAQRLLHAFRKAAADGHHFADRLHGCGEVVVRALELFKGEARDLGDHIIDGRLETRGHRAAGDVVGDLVQRIADRQLGRDLGDGKARRLGSQSGRTRHARVHLDHDQPAILGIDGELYVRTACFHANFAQHRDAGVAHDLIFPVGQRQRRRDGDAVPGVDAHGVHILDRADDDAVVVLVAHHLHLIFFPAEYRFLDQHLGGGAGIQPAAHDFLELLAVIGDAAAGAAHGEAGADDRWQAGMLDGGERLFHRMHGGRARALQADLVHRLAETLAVLRLVDRVRPGADQLDAIFLQRTVRIQRQRAVERGLPAHGRQHGQHVVRALGALLGDDLGDHFGRHRLDIGRVRHIRIGHDRGGVGVDEDDAIALLAQRLDRLRARIIKLARLPDDDGACADDEDGVYVSAFGHGRPYSRGLRCLMKVYAMRQTCLMRYSSRPKGGHAFCGGKLVRGSQTKWKRHDHCCHGASAQHRRNCLDWK